MPPEPNRYSVVKVWANDKPDPHSQSATRTAARALVNLDSFLQIMMTSCGLLKATRIGLIVSVPRSLMSGQPALLTGDAAKFNPGLAGFAASASTPDPVIIRK